MEAVVCNEDVQEVVQTNFQEQIQTQKLMIIEKKKPWMMIRKKNFNGEQESTWLKQSDGITNN